MKANYGRIFTQPRGTIIQGFDDMRSGLDLDAQEGIKLCVLPHPGSGNAVYCNGSFLRSLLSNNTYNSVFLFVDVREVNCRDLPLSIYADNNSLFGPFADCFMTGETERHDL